MKVLSVFVILLIIMGVYSCENNTVAPAVLPSDCDTVNLTYTNTMQLVINLNCGTMNTGCHSSGTGHDFTSYTALERYTTGGKTSRFWQQLFVIKNMPLYPELPLDLCANNQFKIWLLNGAPQ